MSELQPEQEEEDEGKKLSIVEKVKNKSVFVRVWTHTKATNQRGKKDEWLLLYSKKAIPKKCQKKEQKKRIMYIEMIEIWASVSKQRQIK